MAGFHFHAIRNGPSAAFGCRFRCYLSGGIFVDWGGDSDGRRSLEIFALDNWQCFRQRKVNGVREGFFDQRTFKWGGFWWRSERAAEMTTIGANSKTCLWSEERLREHKQPHIPSLLWAIGSWSTMTRVSGRPMNLPFPQDLSRMTLQNDEQSISSQAVFCSAWCPLHSYLLNKCEFCVKSTNSVSALDTIIFYAKRMRVAIFGWSVLIFCHLVRLSPFPWHPDINHRLYYSTAASKYSVRLPCRTTRYRSAFVHSHLPYSHRLSVTYFKAFCGWTIQSLSQIL